MKTESQAHAKTFRELHAPGQILLLANAWDAGSARLIEASGATAIATTSAGLAWSRGHPDGAALPARELCAAVAEIARVVSIPVSADIEDGYSEDPRAVGEMIAAVIDAGAVGVNLEDGATPVDVMCAKIEAAKQAAARAGVDLFVNARTDVYLRRLVRAESAVAESIERGQRYQAAGGDGFFVPKIGDLAEIRAIADAVALPLNVLVMADLAPIADLKGAGVRRVSAGSGIAAAAFGVAQRATKQFLEAGRYDAMFETRVDYGEMNQLLR
jgi:2-methylisocitrate lyase-like PEP mutase family enzyme